VDDAAATSIGVPATGNVLVNDCDQTNTTPASPDNVTAALSTSPTNGAAVVDADGATVYTPEAGFVGTDSFTYTIVTIDAGQPRTDVATVTVTVAAAPVVPPKPELPATGSDDVLPIGLAGGALLLLGGSLVVFARRRQADIG